MATALISSITSLPAYATDGLTVKVYNNLRQNEAPTIPGEDALVLTTSVANIDEDWDEGPVAGSDLAEDVVVKYEGFISANVSGTIYFDAPADDGVRIYINELLVMDDWRDKGRGSIVSDPVSIAAGVRYAFTLYYYENGGFANLQLRWDLGRGNGFEVVPAEAFNGSYKPVAVAKKEAPASAPSRITAQPAGRNSVVVKWGKPTSTGSGKVLRYEIYRNGLRVASVPSTEFSFRDRGLDSTQSYSYRIVTVTSKGKSAKSNQTSAVFPRR